MTLFLFFILIILLVTLNAREAYTHFKEERNYLALGYIGFSIFYFAYLIYILVKVC